MVSLSGLSLQPDLLKNQIYHLTGLFLKTKKKIGKKALNLTRNQRDKYIFFG